MSSSTRIIRCLALALACAAFVVPAAQAGTDAESREAAFRAAHWKHEDSMYTPTLTGSLDVHWNHEDALYEARSVAPSALQAAPVAVEPRGGLTVALVAAAGLLAVVVLGAGALTGIRRRSRRLAPS